MAARYTVFQVLSACADVLVIALDKVLRDLICGGLAGGFATMTTSSCLMLCTPSYSTFRYPFDLVRTRLAAQTEPKAHASMRCDCAKP